MLEDPRVLRVREESQARLDHRDLRVLLVTLELTASTELKDQLGLLVSRGPLGSLDLGDLQDLRVPLDRSDPKERRETRVSLVSKEKLDLKEKLAPLVLREPQGLWEKRGSEDPEESLVRPGLSDLRERGELLVTVVSRVRTGFRALREHLEREDNLERADPRVLGVTLGARGSLAFLEHGV